MISRRPSNTKKKRVAATARGAKASNATIVNALVTSISAQMTSADPAAVFWEKLDDAARSYVVMCVASYRGLISEAPAWADREKRFRPILDAVTRHIRMLKSASRKRRAFQNVKDPRLGKISDLGSLSQPREYEFSVVIDHEVIRLEALARQLQIVCNTKRLGLAGRLYHLILARKYVDLWSQTTGKDVCLKPQTIAEMIWIIDQGAGRKKMNFSLADNLERSLSTFRSNESNAQLIQLLAAHVSDLVEGKRS